MSNRRKWLFRNRRSGFSVVPKRAISTTSKIIYLLSFCSVLALMAAFYFAIEQEGEYGKILGGVGFLCMYLTFLACALSIGRVRQNTEPLPARILAVIVSILALAAWGAVYLLGIIRG